MSVIQTVLPLPKNIIHCLHHRAGYTHTVPLVQCQPLSSYLKKKKKKKHFYRRIEIYKAIMPDFSYILCFMSNKVIVVL